MSLTVPVDAKEDASLTFRGVIEATRDNFPEAKYRPILSPRVRIKAGEHGFYGNSDGTGTKPELAERLATELGDPHFFEFPAFDVVAMVADDSSRDGLFVAGVVNSIDVNTADDPAFITALSRGMQRACDQGGFALLNGETAELGYRTPGYGPNRLNWNATALTIVNEKKIIDGSGLRPGQPVVGLRETSIRSNGLTRARAILEHAYLQKEGVKMSRTQYVSELIREALKSSLPVDEIALALEQMFPGSNLIEQVQLPWHKTFPGLTEQLTTPSTIYTRLIYEAQGGVDGDVRIPILGCAHVSGGGVPLKGKRMVEGRNVGLHLESVFSDPKGIPELMQLANEYPKADGTPFVTDRSACEQWNRGVGMLNVFAHQGHADEFIQMATQMGHEAAIIGETTDTQSINWRGHKWTF